MQSAIVAAAWRCGVFCDPASFPFTAALESNWEAIKAELDRLPKETFTPWVERHVYNFGWDVFAFYIVERRLEENCGRCPETTRLLEAISGMTSAGFSLLRPGAHIRPHVGYNDAVLRCHLPLHVPEGCGLRVGSVTKSWEEGKCLIFDDTVEHEAWNRGTGIRVVLLLDFKKQPDVPLQSTEIDAEWARALASADKPSA